jgi:hypothetical protein
VLCCRHGVAALVYHVWMGYMISMPPSGRFCDLTLLALPHDSISVAFLFLYWLVVSFLVLFTLQYKWHHGYFITWCSWFDVFTTVNLWITYSSVTHFAICELWICDVYYFWSDSSLLCFCLQCYVLTSPSSSKCQNLLLSLSFRSLNKLRRVSIVHTLKSFSSRLKSILADQLSLNLT